MSSHRGVILQKEPDQLVPQEAYEAAAKGCNVMGYSAVIDGELMPITDKKVMSWEEFDKFQKDFQGEPMVLFLGTFPDDCDPQDIQPMVLIDDEIEVEGKKEPEIRALLVGYAEGDFSKFAKKNSKLSAEFHFFEEVVHPILDEYTEKSGEESSIDDLMEYLEQDAQVKRIKAAMTGRGVVKFMTDDNEILSINENKVGFVGDWGNMSQHCGFGQTSETATGEKKKSGWWAKKKGATAAAETPPVKTGDDEKKETVPPGNKEGPTDQKKVADHLGKGLSAPPDGKLFIRPKENLSHKDKREVYDNLCRWCPTAENNNGKGYRQRPWVPADITNIEKTTLSWEKFELRDDPWSVEFMKEQRAKKKKDTETKHIQSAEQIKAEKADDLLTVPSDEVAALLKDFMTDDEIVKVQKGVQGLPQLAAIEAIETKYPSYFQKTGHNITESFHWPPGKWLMHITRYPKATRLLIFGIIAAYVRQASEGDKKLSELAKGEPAKAEEPKAEEKKSGGYFSRKKASAKK